MNICKLKIEKMGSVMSRKRSRTSLNENDCVPVLTEMECSNLVLKYVTSTFCALTNIFELTIEEIFTL